MLLSMWVVHAYIANPTLVDFGAYQRSLTFRMGSKRYGWVTLRRPAFDARFDRIILNIYERRYGKVVLSMFRTFLIRGRLLDRILNYFIAIYGMPEPEHNVSVLVRAVHRRRAARNLAFAMGGHRRLGERSWLATLDLGCIKMILELL